MKTSEILIQAYTLYQSMPGTGIFARNKHGKETGGFVRSVKKVVKKAVKKKAPASAPKVTKPRTVREMLNEIDEFLATAHSDKVHQLWDVLSALRGPDSSNELQKYRTTAVIRAKAFPKATQELTPLSIYVTINRDKTLQSVRDAVGDSDKHFANHVINAVSALENI